MGMTPMQLKELSLSNCEQDAKDRAYKTLMVFKAARGGKFKISEAQFRTELESIYISGEFSAAERLLRAIEFDAELITKDLIIGELHLFILRIADILRRRGLLEGQVHLEDIIDGRHSTHKILNSHLVNHEVQS